MHFALIFSKNLQKDDQNRFGILFAFNQFIMIDLIVDLFYVIGVMGIGGIIEWGFEYKKNH